MTLVRISRQTYLSRLELADTKLVWRFEQPAHVTYRQAEPVRVRRPLVDRFIALRPSLFARTPRRFSRAGLTGSLLTLAVIAALAYTLGGRIEVNP